MEKAEVRLECMKLAAARTREIADTMALAEEFYRWIYPSVDEVTFKSTEEVEVTPKKGSHNPNKKPTTS